MTNETIARLAQEIAIAAKKSFLGLFANGERFYYCALITTWEGHAPFVAAWSWKAWQRAAQALEDPTDAERIKWSYADSPYDIVGEAHFSTVQKLFAERPPIHTLSDAAYGEELHIRFKAMEMAMKTLDMEGLFNRNQPRDSVCVLVEPMPPDRTNTEIALRLNDPASPAMQAWLAEAAE